MTKCAQDGCDRAGSRTLRFDKWWCEDHLPRFDPVERPAHYANMGIEPIDALEAWLSRDEFVAHCRATAIVYLVRAGRKDGEPIERDLAKARWYVNRAYEAVMR